ncbi:MAG: ribbon-helix-helix domain-containing protein [Calothrix sp. SM1_5_4]|nr:ribbon-helix-helix domain-containing protein [Calothrix sp. SM1_5_4]
MSKKLATTVYITERQQALLKELNSRSKVPVAEFIRQGIDMVLARYSDILPGQNELPPGQFREPEPLLTNRFRE